MAAGAAGQRVSVGDLLGAAFRAYGARWQSMFRIVGIVAIPVQLATAYWIWAFLPDQLWRLMLQQPKLFGKQPAPPEIDPEQLIGFGIGAIVVVVLTMLSQQVALAACYREVVTGFVGAPSDWRGSLRFLNRHGPRILRLTLLAFVLQTIGFVACVIPGVFMFVYWTASLPALLSEDRSARRALGRSYRLIHDGWWRAFAVILIVFFIVSIGGQFLGAPTWLFFETDNRVLIALAFSAASVFSMVIFSPLYAAVAGALYLEGRERHEGPVDLAELARSVDVEPPVEIAPVFPTPVYRAPAPPIPEPAAPTSSGAPPFWPPPPGWTPENEKPE
jgi:hypothetical protein